MRYPAAEKLEIIRLVEQSPLSVRDTLAKLGIPRATFYRWYDRYGAGKSTRPLMMLLPMKQIFGKSVAAEEPMVCVTHRRRRESTANSSLKTGLWACEIRRDFRGFLDDKKSV